MAENEVIFRRRNEEIKRGFDKIKKIATEDDQAHLVVDDDMPLHFYCECSDEKCRERVVLRPSRYNAIHKNRRLFVAKKGHEVVAIERVVKVTDEYIVVEKRLPVPEPTTDTLHPTDIHNAD